MSNVAKFSKKNQKCQGNANELLSGKTCKAIKIDTVPVSTERTVIENGIYFLHCCFTTMIHKSLPHHVTVRQTKGKIK